MRLSGVGRIKPPSPRKPECALSPLYSSPRCSLPARPRQCGWLRFLKNTLRAPRSGTRAGDWGDAKPPRVRRRAIDAGRRACSRIGRHHEPSSQLPGALGRRRRRRLMGPGYWWVGRRTARVQIPLVTGTSTGALLAPFAFLGPKYDATLQKLYTELSTSDLVERRGLLDILRDGFGSRALSRCGGSSSRHINDEVIAELAAQYRRGRFLFIGTTNLDAARPVTWNVTRIAASGSPRARTLIHDRDPRIGLDSRDLSAGED